MPTNPMRWIAMVLALSCPLAACTEDSDNDGATGTPTDDGSNSMGPSADEPGESPGGDVDDPGGDALYVVTSYVTTPDGDTLLVWLAPDFSAENFAVDQAALQVVGGGNVRSDGTSLFITSDEQQTITRYDIGADRQLQEGETISFIGRGLTWMGRPILVSEQRAFTINQDEGNIIEWNPSDMTITGEHDISGLLRDDIGHELRADFVRKSDGTIFFYWTYTSDRVEFINSFFLGVFDTQRNELSIIEQPACPATAGFGGFFDEQGDLYLFADSFGMFTQLNDYPDAKDSCVLRINDGEQQLDPDFMMKPIDSMDGKHPWGLFYAGDGLAYTTAVDLDDAAGFDTVYEFIGAEVHSPWLVDIRNGSAQPLDKLPKTAVGFGGHTVDNRLLIPRTTADIDADAWDNVQAVVFELDTETGEARDLFPLPGFIGIIERIR